MKDKNPWWFVPSLYFCEGLPYGVIVYLTIVFLKRSGMANADIGLWTSVLYLPWIFKPLWSPVVDVFWTKRQWVWAMQFSLGLTFAVMAFSLVSSSTLSIFIILLFLAAFFSATHNVAADGFYILGLNDQQKAIFAGIPATFYRLSLICCQGGLVLLAGTLEKRFSNVIVSWSIVFATVAFFMFVVSLWHWKFLTYPSEDVAKSSRDNPIKTKIAFKEAFSSYFKKPGIVWILLFLLTYRLGEGQLIKMVVPFLLDSMEIGGLAMTTKQVGLVHGIVGMVALLVGGIAGGVVIGKWGLKRVFFVMWALLNLPNIFYFLLAVYQPHDLAIVSVAIAIEQFCYGLGFTAYLLYMIYTAGKGEWSTAHFSISTGFMTLGMMLSGLISGYMQQWLGYQHFFLWVLVSAFPAVIAIRKLPFSPHFSPPLGKS